MPKFYVVATPIGNLSDISPRALEVLKSVDTVVCEDTRHTQNIFSRYNLSRPVLSYHLHSYLGKIKQILDLLREGKNLALVSDAGTPGISDPGQYLISQIWDKLHATEIISIPGPSAVISAASVSGFNTDQFLFLGFLPLKGRAKSLAAIVESPYTIIFYEAPHRILKTLAELEPLLGPRRILVARELTKKFESLYRGTIAQVLEKLGTEVKGELVVLVEGTKAKH